MTRRRMGCKLPGPSLQFEDFFQWTLNLAVFGCPSGSFQGSLTGGKDPAGDDNRAGAG